MVNQPDILKMGSKSFWFLGPALPTRLPWPIQCAWRTSAHLAWVGAGIDGMPFTLQRGGVVASSNILGWTASSAILFWVQGLLVCRPIQPWMLPGNPSWMLSFIAWRILVHQRRGYSCTAVSRMRPCMHRHVDITSKYANKPASILYKHACTQGCQHMMHGGHKIIARCIRKGNRMRSVLNTSLNVLNVDQAGIMTSTPAGTPCLCGSPCPEPGHSTFWRGEGLTCPRSNHIYVELLAT